MYVPTGKSLVILGKDRVRRAEGRSQSEVSFEEEVKIGLDDTFERFLLRIVRKGGHGWRGPGGKRCLFSIPARLCVSWGLFAEAVQ